MGNEARYWFKQRSSVLLTEEQQKKNKKWYDYIIRLGGLIDNGYKGEGIEFTDDIQKSLDELHFARTYDPNSQDGYEAIYETTEINDKIYLYFIYAKATNSWWKQTFEKFCTDNKIPAQMWGPC